MTYWADNIKFIKDIQDSKYKKIEDAIADMEEQSGVISKESDNKKAREHFLEAARTLELVDIKELGSLAETMFKDMPDTEKEKEKSRLEEIEKKFQEAMKKIEQVRKEHKI